MLSPIITALAMCAHQHIRAYLYLSRSSRYLSFACQSFYRQLLITLLAILSLQFIVHSNMYAFSEQFAKLKTSINEFLIIRAFVLHGDLFQHQKRERSEFRFGDFHKETLVYLMDFSEQFLQHLSYHPCSFYQNFMTHFLKLSFLY